jgi:hypothetical protein
MLDFKRCIRIHRVIYDSDFYDYHTASFFSPSSYLIAMKYLSPIIGNEMYCSVKLKQFEITGFDWNGFVFMPINLVSSVVKTADS